MDNAYYNLSTQYDSGATAFRWPEIQGKIKREIFYKTVREELKITGCIDT